jgi:hypothetical protein
MAVNKQINIDINSNADQTAQDFNNLSRSINNTNQALEETENIASQGAGTDKLTNRLDELDVLLNSGTLSFREMNKLMQEYQSVAAQAGTETPIGSRAIQSAAGLRDQIADLQTRTRLLSSDYIKLDTTLAALGAGSQVFSGITSAMALTGVESEELQKTMVKLQAVQGVANSISAVTNALNKDAILGIQLRIFWEKAKNKVIGTSIGLMKGLRIAMASTGIGLLIAGIGLLIENFDKLLKFFSPIIDGFKAIGDAIGITNFAEQEQEAERERRHQLELARIE